MAVRRTTSTTARRILSTADHRVTPMTTTHWTVRVVDHRVPRVTARRALRGRVEHATLMTTTHRICPVVDHRMTLMVARRALRIPGDRAIRAAHRRPAPTPAHRANRLEAHPAPDHTTTALTTPRRAALALPSSSIPGSVGRRSTDRIPMTPRRTTSDRMLPYRTPTYRSAARLSTAATRGGMTTTTHLRSDSAKTAVPHLHPGRIRTCSARNRLCSAQRGLPTQGRVPGSHATLPFDALAAQTSEPMT